MVGSFHASGLNDLLRHRNLRLLIRCMICAIDDLGLRVLLTAPTSQRCVTRDVHRLDSLRLQ